MMKSISKYIRESDDSRLKKRIAYRVDVIFSAFPYAKILGLLSATLLLIGLGAVSLYTVNHGKVCFLQTLWLSWTFVADSGNQANQVGPGPRTVSVLISSGGMLIFATMVGLVSDAISEKVDSWRKGKSDVIETNHILILGWSDKFGSVLKQLAIANKCLGGAVVVVLAEKDKEDMEVEVAKLDFDLFGTKFICRSGNPLILADLQKARAIIVLAADENVDQSDARALRVVLSLSAVKEGLRGHVVVEMDDLDNEPMMKLAGSGLMIETLFAKDMITELMIKCVLQPGIAQIWEGILGFENAEFYIKRWPQLDGMRFGDVLFSFPDAVPCGVKVASNGGKIIINPDDNYIIGQGDEILVIAEDRTAYSPAPSPQIQYGFLPNILASLPKDPEKLLLCGWQCDIDSIIMMAEAYLAPGSQVWILNQIPEKEREQMLNDAGLDVSVFINVTLIHREGNTGIRRHLESLPIETFDSILILADKSDKDSLQDSDSRSLATILLIRDIQLKRSYGQPKDIRLPRGPRQLAGISHRAWIREMQRASDKSIIITEVFDTKTKNLFSISKISDYILSNELVSMALAMVAEDKQINRVLERFLSDEETEICFICAELYLHDQEELSFYDVMARARGRREIVIGYRLAHTSQAIINPGYRSAVRNWSRHDMFVVISTEEVC